MNFKFSISSLLRLQTDQQLDCALDLMRRLPPQQIEKNLSDLIDLVPELCEELLSSIDQPLKIASDKKVGKDYLLCDYNRDGDSYRSQLNSFETKSARFVVVDFLVGLLFHWNERESKWLMSVNSLVLGLMVHKRDRNP